jgi:large conductance mechanosensitive channel
MWKEFLEFINRGNVLDLAVAVIIGAAFGAITASLVDQVIMPVIGLLIGGVDFSNLGFILKDRGMYSSVQEAVAAGAPVIQLGAFINTVINFLIIAFVVFLIIRSFNNMQTRMFPKKPVVAAPVEPTREEVLLTEIRDLLAKGR